MQKTLVHQSYAWRVCFKDRVLCVVVANLSKIISALLSLNMVASVGAEHPNPAENFSINAHPTTVGQARLIISTDAFCNKTLFTNGAIMHNKFIILVVVIALTLSGCANLNQSQSNVAQGTAVGTGIGAAVGAVIGAIAGDPALGAGIGAGVGAVGGYIWSSRMEKQKRDLEAATAGTGIAVTQTENNLLKMNIPGDATFDSGSARIKPNMYPVLNSVAAGLASNPTSQAMIAGHTDDTGSDQVNNPLSINRAGNTRAYLVSRGIASERIVIDGRGAYSPIVPNDSPRKSCEESSD